MKKSAANPTEYGGVAADAEHQRQQSDGCEAGILHQHANAVTNILENADHEFLLFIAQRGIGIQTHRAARGNVRREQGNRAEQRANKDEGERVRGFYAEKQTREELRGGKRCANAKDESESGETDRLAKNQA